MYLDKHNLKAKRKERKKMDEPKYNRIEQLVGKLIIKNEFNYDQSFQI